MLLADAVLNMLSEDLYITCNGRKVKKGDVIDNTKVYRLWPRLRGGKGGFGSMLRTIGAQIEKTTNREAMRDLSGRRMRDINNEKKLADWVAGSAERERQQEERRQERLEKRRAEAEGRMHKFRDEKYLEQKEAVATNLDDALTQGLKRSTAAHASAPVKKKGKRIPATTSWAGLELDDLSSSDDEVEQKPVKESELDRLRESAEVVAELPSSKAEAPDVEPSTKSDEPTLQQADVEQGNVEKGDVEKGNVEQRDVEQGNVENGDVEKGNVEQGNVEQGNVEKGNVEKGDVEKEDVEQRDVEQGNVENGDVDKGNVEQGNVQQRDVEQGNVEKGDVDKGNVEKEDVEKGNVEKGNVEKGNVDIKLSPEKQQSGKESGTTTDAPTVMEPIDLESHKSAEELENYGLDHLKHELMSRGLKCGGSITQRAQRLYSVKGLKREEIDSSLFAKKRK